MDYEVILNIIIKILAAIFVSFASLAASKLKVWLATKIDEKNLSKIKDYICEFCMAAEQTLKAEDPTGEKRKAYVIEQLMRLNVEVTPYINAMIEAFVYNLPKGCD